MGKMCSTCAVAFSRCHGRVPCPTAGHSEFLTAVCVCVHIQYVQGRVCMCLRVLVFNSELLTNYLRLVKSSFGNVMIAKFQFKFFIPK